MVKELKYAIFLITIVTFFFFSVKYYISDNYKKKSYRSIDILKNKIEIIDLKLPVLKNDTDNIIDWVENNTNKEKNKFKFWNLLSIK
jgi:hypothetical protein|tara:strand:+ start:63 stop:323 length:261 start_codon:yes stop_codon:yes gene_type:complete